MYQDNQYLRRLFIPNYQSYNAGIFITEKYSHQKWDFEGGVRFDYRSIYNTTDNENKFSYLGETIHHTWLQLNNWIHITEVALVTTEEVFPHYGAVITANPPYPGRRLEEVDKLFLSTDFSWGHLYLGYNTLGKDYASVFQDNDVRVITNKQIKIQEKYSSEVALCFHNNDYSRMQKKKEVQFYQWYESLDQEIQELIPIENLNSLSLGNYYLGHLLINKHFLEFHPVAEDWWTNQNIQKRWNNEVFSKIERVLDIKIYE